MPIPHVVVVGSINMDLVARMARRPRAGETIHGDSFCTIPGGKGANQAVAAARLGARVTLIGCLGADEFGVALRAALVRDGVSVDHVMSVSDCSSGVALIQVDAAGTNAISVIAGANARLTPQQVQERAQLIASADVLIAQLETPLETVAAAIEVARRAGVRTILDPAPAPVGALPSELMNVDLLSPNQTEAEALTGLPVADVSGADVAARQLKDAGAREVVIKLGGLGAWVQPREGDGLRVPARPVTVVDSTAAGDAFTAALAVGLAEGRSLIESTRWGCAAGTLACLAQGAQPSLPTRAAMLALLQQGAGA